MGIMICMTLLEADGPMPGNARKSRTARVEWDGSFKLDSLVPGWYAATLTALENAPRKPGSFTPAGPVDLGRVRIEAGLKSLPDFTLP